MSPSIDSGLRRAALIVAVANLAYFGVEFCVARAIGSVSLFADAVDFLEDASVNLLIVLALGWTARNRARLGMALAGLLLVPALAMIVTTVEKLLSPTPPQPEALSLTGLGAFVVNVSCAVLLARYRAHGGSLSRAAFLSARNDAVANIAIILAGLTTAAVWRSAWPDLLVGVGIGLMNLDAAREVWTVAKDDNSTAT